MDAQQSTEVHTGGGAAIGGDTNAGRDVTGRDSRTEYRQRSRTDSHNVVVQAGDDLAPWAQSALMQLRVDYQLLSNVFWEFQQKYSEDSARQTAALEALRTTMQQEIRALQQRDRTARETTRTMVQAIERQVQAFSTLPPQLPSRQVSPAAVYAFGVAILGLALLILVALLRGGA